MFIAQSMKYPDHIKSIKEIDDNGLVVEWRSTTFIVHKNLSVYEYDDGVATGSDIAILIERTIRRSAVEF